MENLRRKMPVNPPVGILLAFLFLLLALAIFRHAHDIDESQNLHLVFGWNEGEIPYRDRFDNHAPLFAMVFSPLAALVGKSPDIVLFARLAIVPIGLATLGFIFLIARRIGGDVVAWWSVILCLAFADWSLKMIEFRPDTLWALFWFAALWLILKWNEHPRAGLAFGAGLILGLALCTSIKTLFLLPPLGLGWIAVQWVAARSDDKRLGQSLQFLLLGAIGGIVPLIALTAFFHQMGVTWEQVHFCLIEVNKKPFETWRLVAAACFIPVIAGGAILLFRGHDKESSNRAMLFIAAGVYLALLYGFAPEMRKQTFLVLTPLVIILGCWAGFLFRPVKIPHWAATLVLAGFLIHFIVESRLWRDGLADQRELLAEVIQLLDADETILDGRGETIFGKRPVYLAFVEIVTKKIQAGELPKPDVTALQAGNTAIAIGSMDGLPKVLRNFLESYYLLSIEGELRVAGQWLKPELRAGQWDARVTVPIPGDYVIVDNGKLQKAITIGQSGDTTISLATADGPTALIWKEAWDEGFRPSK